MSELRYRWVVANADRAFLSAEQQGLDLRALTFRRLSLGRHVFALELTNADGLRDRSRDLVVTVVPTPSPKVTLPCSASTCERTASGTYEMEVNWDEQVTLQLHIASGAVCNSKLNSDEWEFQIDWEHRESDKDEWQPVPGDQLQNNRYWLNIQRYTLQPCSAHELRVTVTQTLFHSQTVVSINLHPREVALLVNAESNGYRFGYDDVVALKADARVDPLRKFFQATNTLVRRTRWCILHQIAIPSLFFWRATS